MVLNGSHRTASEDATKHTVIVLPDFTFVNEVPGEGNGGMKKGEERGKAEEFWKKYLDPRGTRGGDLRTEREGTEDGQEEERGEGGDGDGEEGFKSWVLPYDAVILLCEYSGHRIRGEVLMLIWAYL